MSVPISEIVVHVMMWNIRSLGCINPSRWDSGQSQSTEGTEEGWRVGQTPLGGVFWKRGADLSKN